MHAQKDDAAAVQYFKKALEISPNSPEVLKNLAIVSASKADSAMCVKTQK